MTTLELPLARAETPLPTWTKILCALFFCSGFPALIYQLTWQRELFRIFGVNSESVTIVVTAFMLGLGLGSLAGGWLSKRQGISLLPLLAAIEIATAAFGIVSLYVFEQVGAVTVDWPLLAMAALNLALVISDRSWSRSGARRSVAAWQSATASRSFGRCRMNMIYG
jgi:spermidine synthase